MCSKQIEIEGKVSTFYTEEELKEIQETHTKEKGELEGKVKELEVDKTAIDWRNTRKLIDKQKELLKKQGVELDDDGNEIKKPTTLTTEEIEQQARKAAKEELLNSHKDRVFSGYKDPEQRKVVEYYFNKLSAGEELTIDKIDGFVAEAEKHINPSYNPDRRRVFGAAGTGGIPSKEEKEESFADTEEGKEAANAFGFNFAKQPKK